MSSLLNNPPPAAIDVEAEFRRLADWWNRETKYLSNLNKAYQHPAYQQILALGPAVIPVILKDLESDPNWLIGALWDLTGANPVPQEHRGRLREMAADWLEWGRKNGYRW